jgi:hypothetical protein
LQLPQRNLDLFGALELPDRYSEETRPVRSGPFLCLYVSALFHNDLQLSQRNFDLFGQVELSDNHTENLRPEPAMAAGRFHLQHEVTPMVQRFYSKSECEADPEIDPFRILFDLLQSLGYNDVLIVPAFADFGSDTLRKGVFRTLIGKGIRLHVRHVAAQHEAEFASFKAESRRARFDRAKARGAYRYCGRKPTLDRDAIRRLNDEGLPRDAIAKQLGYGRTSVWRVLKAA